MKPQLTATRKRQSEAALSLQEELVAAIHGAFEVAVEIAVREVSRLVGQATGDIFQEMRRENESLKQRLQRAEAMLETGGSSPPPTQHLTGRPDSPLRVGGAHGYPGVRGDTPPADPQQSHVGGQSDAAADPQPETGGAAACEAFTREVSEEMSPVRVVSVNQTRRDLAAQDHNSPPQVAHVTVKQETPEEERDGSACCLDSIKVEDFTSECMLAVQSKMLEEWKPEVLDIQSQDSDSEPGLAHAPNLYTNLPPSSDLPSPSSEFPNIVQLAEPAPIPEAPPQVYGVHGQTSRNLGRTFTNLYTCKFCGQTFHLPSLLRRHTGQCPQRLQQCCQQPIAGSKRTRQVYPPGCSLFRCTECNREFNRMENLKTHLRIHTGERPYTCSVCSKCFRHSGALTRHFRIHTGEKPYICGQCGKSFRNCGGLKFHQRSHSEQLQ